MKAQSLWQGAIVFTSFIGLILIGALFYKAYSKKPRRIGPQETYVKLDPSKVNQIKIVKPLRATKYTRGTKKYAYLGRSVSSYHTASLNDLFGPYGPLKGLSARERFQFKKQVVGYVDHKVRSGAIDPRNRHRYIEMKVLDKSLEMMEARAEN